MGVQVLRFPYFGATHRFQVNLPGSGSGYLRTGIAQPLSEVFRRVRIEAVGRHYSGLLVDCDELIGSDLRERLALTARPSNLQADAVRIAQTEVQPPVVHRKKLDCASTSCACIWPPYFTVTRAPMALRFDLTPTSLTLSQCLGP